VCEWDTLPLSVLARVSCGTTLDLLDRSTDDLGQLTVNGVAELHSGLVKSVLFKDFVEFYGPSKFTNVTNGMRRKAQITKQSSLLKIGALNRHHP
jgi:hypothetical protein